MTSTTQTAGPTTAQTTTGQTTGQTGKAAGATDPALAQAVAASSAGKPTTLHPAAGGDLDRARRPLDPAAVDADALRTVMDGRWGAVRDRMRRDLPAEFCQPTDHLATEEHRTLTMERMHVLAAQGEHRAGFAPNVGGTADLGAQTVNFEMLGLADISLTIKSGVQWGLFAGSIQALGTARHHQEHLPAAMDMSLPGCFAMTETGHGSDVASLGTTATYDPETAEFVVHTPDAAARKDYIGSAARDARLAVVFAQLHTGGESHGVHALLVPLREADGTVMPGITITDCGRKGGLNGVDNGRIVFDHVRVPREALLDKHGQVSEDGTYSSTTASRNARFFTTLGALVKGRVCIGGGALAATRQALAIAVTHAERRTQFPRAGAAAGEEVTLLDYRTHQRRLLPLLARTVVLGFAQDDLTADLHDVQNPVLHGIDVDGEAQRRLEHRAAGMKAIVTWHATTAIQGAREACGGSGYLSENRLVQLKADTDVFTTFEGDNTVLLQLVAKGMLSGYRDTFKGLDKLGQAKAVTGQLVDTLAVRTEVRALAQRFQEVRPGTTGDDGELLDRDWQLRTLAWRERRVLESLVSRVRAGSKERDAFDVVNEVQDHMQLAARAHVEHEVVRSAADAIGALAEGPVKDLLSRVLDLHVIAELERDRAWFLEHGWISPRRSKALVSAVNDLCAELRPHASTLVAGFGIPREWWGASITA